MPRKSLEHKTSLDKSYTRGQREVADCITVLSNQVVAVFAASSTEALATAYLQVEPTTCDKGAEKSADDGVNSLK